MFCTQCGARNADEAKFCSQCGKAIAATAAAAPPPAAAPRPVHADAGSVRTAATPAPLPRTIGPVAPSYHLGRIDDIHTAQSATMMAFLFAVLTVGLGITRYFKGEASLVVVGFTVAVAVALWYMSRLAALFGLALGLYLNYLYFVKHVGEPWNMLFMILLPIVALSAVRGTFAFHRLIDVEKAKARSAATAPPS